MIEKKCGDFGKLNYSLPNIPQAMRILGEMGIGSKITKKSFEGNELIYLSKLVELMEPLVSDIDLNINGKIVTTYSELLKHFEMLPYLSEIAGEIFKSLNISDKKKS